MWLTCTFIVNSGLSFLLGLAVAGVLGPEEYGRFAVASLVAIVLCTVLFDWLRLSTTRFCSVQARSSDPDLGASLNLGYLGMVLLLAACLLLMLCLGIDTPLTIGVVAIIAVTAVANGGFEYGAALARAMFLNRAYARLVMLKNGFGFVSMVAAGYLLGSSAPVLAMFALSTAAATLCVRGTLTGPSQPLSAARRERLAAFARYGWPIVGANLAYQAIVLVNRVVATSLFGYAASGQLSLATDVTVRLFLSVGAALDVFLFQVAVHRGATEGAPAAHRQIARNMVLVTAALVLVAVGYLAAMPAFEALVVPVRFRGDFGRISTILVPGVLAFCLVQFALSPVFQMAQRTSPVLVTALVSLAVDAAGLVAMSAAASVTSLAWLHTASLGAGLAVAAWQAFRIRECRPAWRDLAAVTVAAGAAALVIWPMRDLRPAWLACMMAGGFGGPVYLAVLTAFDVAGLRHTVRGAARRVAQHLPTRLVSARLARVLG